MQEVGAGDCTEGFNMAMGSTVYITDLIGEKSDRQEREGIRCAGCGHKPIRL
jgi:DNA-directed RNA polymerase subunit RPC12/RpoP